MKIRAKANGDVIDVPEDAATHLIEAGIYDAVETDGKETPPPVPPRKKAPK
jgi:hypothetical protein